MPPVSSEAVCVRHWDFSETSQTVSLFTRDLGMLRGLAKGAKRERGRFSGGIDLLTRGRVIALVKSGRELATLTDWDLLETFRHLRSRLDINGVAFYMAELACRMIADAHPHPRSYDALVTALRELAAPARIDAALLRYQWTLLDDCGYRPSLEMPPGASIIAFSPAAGGVIEMAPGVAAWPVRRETIERIRRLEAEQGGAAEGQATRGEEGAREPEGELDGGASAEALLAIAQAEAAATHRAARLLAGYTREVLGFEPSTMSEVFGSIPALRRQEG